MVRVESSLPPPLPAKKQAFVDSDADFDAYDADEDAAVRGGRHRGKDAAYALRPLHAVLSLCGMCKYAHSDSDEGSEPRNPPPFAKFYAVLWLILVAFAATHVIMSYLELDFPSIIKVLYVMSLVSSAITCFVGVIKSSFLVSADTLRMLSNLNAIDAKVADKDSPHHDSLRRRIIAFELAFACIHSAYFAYEEAYYSTSSELHTNLLEHTLNVLTNVQLVDFACALLANNARLRMANERLKGMLAEYGIGTGAQRESSEGSDEKKKGGGSMMENFYNDFKGVNREAKYADMVQQKKSDEIVYFLKIFDSIADNIQIVNDTYGLTLLFVSMTAFLNILSTINALIMFESVYKLNPDFSKSVILLWSAPIVLFILIATYISEMLKDEVEQTTFTIDKLTINPQTDAHQLELLECFSQLLTGRNVFITAYNFFNFDFSFIFSLVGTIATYAVILMQVNETDSGKGGGDPAANSTNSTNSTPTANVTT